MQYIKLIRPHHWIKNFLIYLPIFFSKNILSGTHLLKVTLGFFAFSFLASFIYTINDIRDAEQDRQHEVKSKRPVAAGVISKKNAFIFSLVMLGISIFFNIQTGSNTLSWLLLIVYFILNIGYSLGLKAVPLVDVIILVSGFLIRVLYGGSVADVEVSKWLYLTTVSFSFFLSFGKRRNEIRNTDSGGRSVLKFYTAEYLDKNMYMCLTLSIVFYSLWCVGTEIENMLWSVLAVMVISMKYLLNISKKSLGDPVDVVLGDKMLLLMVFGYSIAMFVLVY